MLLVFFVVVVVAYSMASGFVFLWDSCALRCVCLCTYVFLVLFLSGFLLFVCFALFCPNYLLLYCYPLDVCLFLKGQKRVDPGGKGVAKKLVGVCEGV